MTEYFQDLTPAESRVLQYLEIYRGFYNRSPTVRQITIGLQYKSTNSVFTLMRQLQRKGYLSLHKKSRNITLIHDPKNPKAIQTIHTNDPLAPIYMDCRIVEGSELMQLKVSDDSAAEFGFHLGDYAIVDKAVPLSTLTEGKLIAITDLGSFPVIRKYRSNDRGIVILEANNKIYRYPNDQLQYIGLVKSLMRLLNSITPISERQSFDNQQENS